MRRWFFERFQKSVEGLLRKHMHFIHDIDLVTCAGWTVAHAIDQFADIVHTSTRRGIHFHNIHVTVLGDSLAMLTNATGFGCRALLTAGAGTIEGTGEDAGC